MRSGDDWKPAGVRACTDYGTHWPSWRRIDADPLNWCPDWPIDDAGPVRALMGAARSVPRGAVRSAIGRAIRLAPYTVIPRAERLAAVEHSHQLGLGLGRNT